MRYGFLSITLLAWMPAFAVGPDRSTGDGNRRWVATKAESATPVPPGLALADLERIAFQSNPTLARAAARMQAAQGRQVQAGRYPNPVVGYHATEIGNRGTAGQQGGFISQRFITAGKLKLDQQIVGKEIDVAHFQFHGH